MKTYVFPFFSPALVPGIRIGGAGLGNLLFVFSRALILSEVYHFSIINPSWPSLKVGPWLRGEREKRFYTDLFEPIGISGGQKQFLLSFLSKIPESSLQKTIEDQHLEQIQGKVIVVKGLKNYFHDIFPHQNMIRENIYKTIKKKYLSDLEQFQGQGIGVHLRLGDFRPEWRVSSSWFIEMIAQIRAIKGQNTPVFLFTDGHEDDPEVKTLLKTSNTFRCNLGNPLLDMLALGKCQLILASNSTFSAWAALLGNSPIVWNKKDPALGRIFSDDTFDGVIAEGSLIPSALFNQLKW